MSYIKMNKEERDARIEQQLDQVRKKLSKWADKVIVGQYTGKPKEDHEESDTWEENGKTWTIKNGVKQTVSRLETVSTPWWCPRCKTPLNGKLHVKMWRIKGACHDCWIKYETKMRIDGVWDAYEKRSLWNSEKDWLKEQIAIQEDHIRNFNTQMHYQDGRWEEFADKSMMAALFETLEKDITFMLQRAERIDLDEQDYAENIKKLEEWEHDNPWN